VGRHLARYLVAQDVDVLGTALHVPEEEEIFSGFRYLFCDVCSEPSLEKVLKNWQPDYIFHLAAQSSVSRSWTQTRETFEINLLGELNLLEVLRRLEMPAKVLVSCSSHEYGRVEPQDLPISEGNPLRPDSPYALSKVFQELLAKQYFEAHGLHIVVTRAFNHAGPGQGTGFVCADFAKQIAEAEAGITEPIIYVGNLEAKRDFTDVRDIVRAYWLILTRGQAGETYNVCSAKAYAVSEILDILASNARVKIEVRKDPDRIRPADIPILLGDATKIFQATGWKPKIPFEQTLEDVLDYWRQITGQKEDNS
jgi:GDP-4-dehydro-6-deoxy-D-mannose reductase